MRARGAAAVLAMLAVAGALAGALARGAGDARPPAGESAAPSELERRYPLGTRTLAERPAQSHLKVAGRAPSPRDPGGASEQRTLLVAALLATVLACAGLAIIAGRHGRPRDARARGRRRTVPRRRRTVSPLVYAIALHAGFRYSSWRDALVLRVVGRRYGPVLRRRTAREAPVRAPARRANGRSRGG